MRPYALLVFTFLVVSAVASWGAYWKLKRIPDAELCAARVLFCRRDSEADAFVREVERESGEKGPPAGILWCHCVWKLDP